MLIRIRTAEIAFSTHESNPKRLADTFLLTAIVGHLH